MRKKFTDEPFFFSPPASALYGVTRMRAGEPSTREPGAPGAVRLALVRHQQRREQGIPTLGVLVGAPAEAAAVWRDWANSAGRQVSIRQPGDPLDGQPGESVLLVCGDAGESLLASLVENLCRALDTPAAEAMASPLALAVPAAAAAAFLRDEPFSRARTLFAEGMVFLPVDSPLAVPGSPINGFSDPSGALPAASLTGVSVRGETTASFAAAASALHDQGTTQSGTGENDRARSAAERFLFELLHDLPETAGLFELNVRLGFCFGPMLAEVDLLAAGLRLAVEIDGYHHFRDPDAYRRDRRKDALLQRQGFLVLRFLAEDVVVRLEEILVEIRTAVAFRRATLPRT